MANDTATLVLDGSIPARQYNDAVNNFDGLINALTDEVSRHVGIDWLVDGLEFTETDPYASAKTTIRGEAKTPEAVERVVQAYSIVGEALSVHRAPPYGDPVRKYADSLVSVLNGKIVSIRFETSEKESTITKAPIQEAPFRILPAHGAIEGRIETLTKRHGLRFTLYDTLNDRAVSCYLEPGNEDKIRDVWGKRAIVEGIVTRDPITGRPTTMRHITDIVPLDDLPPGSYRNARGIFTFAPGAPSPEHVIRRLRNAR